MANTKQQIVTGDFLQILQSNSEIANPDNWKPLTRKPYVVYMTGIYCDVRYKVAPKESDRGYELDNKNRLIYGPGKRISVLNESYISYSDYIQESTGIRGNDYVKSRMKVMTKEQIPNSARYFLMDNPPVPDKIPYLPWTRLLYNKMEGQYLFGFKCPKHWQKVRINVQKGAFEWVQQTTQYNAMYLNLNPNQPDFIVLPVYGGDIKRGLTVEDIMRYARFYDLLTFSKMFDMRTFPGLPVEDFTIQEPETIFKTLEEKQKDEEKNVQMINVLKRIKDSDFASCVSCSAFEINPQTELEDLKFPSTFYIDLNDMPQKAKEQVMKLKEQKLKENVVVVIRRDAAFLQIVLKTQFDAWMLSKGLAIEAMLYNPDKMRIEQKGIGKPQDLLSFFI